MVSDQPEGHPVCQLEDDAIVNVHANFKVIIFLAHEPIQVPPDVIRSGIRFPLAAPERVELFGQPSVFTFGKFLNGQRLEVDATAMGHLSRAG